MSVVLCKHPLSSTTCGYARELRAASVIAVSSHGVYQQPQNKARELKSFRLSLQKHIAPKSSSLRPLHGRWDRGFAARLLQIPPLLRVGPVRPTRRPRDENGNQCGTCLPIATPAEKSIASRIDPENYEQRSEAHEQFRDCQHNPLCCPSPSRTLPRTLLHKRLPAALALFAALELATRAHYTNHMMNQRIAAAVSLLGRSAVRSGKGCLPAALRTQSAGASASTSTGKPAKW